MSKMPINGVTYAFDTYGDPSNEPVMLLHGFAGCRADWDSFARIWADRNFVITVDLLGHGQSESPEHAERYRIDRIATDLAALLDALGIDRIHLLGYSMGGRVALTFASLYSERILSLVLESSSPGLRTEHEREQRMKSDAELADQIESKGLEWFVDYWGNLPLFATMRKLDPRIVAQIRQQRLRQNPLGLANSLRGMGTGSQMSWWDSLPQLNIPVLLIVGSEDAKFVDIAKEMLELLPNAKRMIVPEAGHNVHLEQPEPFQAHVLTFIRQRQDS